MKQKLKVIRITLVTLLIAVMSQGAAFATGSNNSTSSEGLSGLQTAGAFFLLMLAILLPLVKSSRKEVAHKQ